MPAIQSFTITCDALNEYETFSEGDPLTGKVTLALSKETTIESLFVKVKGDADVRWTTKSGDHSTTYSATKRYFKLKQFLIPGDVKDTVVRQGIHVYDFRFQIPQGSMPSSFKGLHGIIVYKLEAKLSRSWRMDSTVEKNIHFVSKSYPNLQYLMSKKAASTKKEMGLFSKGHVNMEVFVDKGAYAPGETIMVVAKINNSSSSDMTPKFTLIQDVVYRARGNTKHEGKVINKVVDNCIRPQTQKEVRCAIQIPRDQMLTIENCDILSVKHHLKGYLDISFAFDPEVVIPVTIIPSVVALGFQPHGAVGPYPAGAVGGPSRSDFTPPAQSMNPYPPRDIHGPSNRDFPPAAPTMVPFPASPRSGSPGYPRSGSPGYPRSGSPGYPRSGSPGYPRSGSPGYPRSGSPGYPGAERYSVPRRAYPDNPPVYAGPSGAYPAHPSHVNGGNNNYPSPYGSSFSSSSSSVLHPPPTVPTFQPTPSAPQMPPCPPPFSISPTAPTYNLLPSAPMMDTDFLSQSDEAPPAYSLLFPSPATDRSDAK